MKPEPQLAAHRSFSRTAAATYGTNLAAAVLSLANVIITARLLGPAGRGSVTFLTTTAMLAANLAVFGIHEANANIGGSEPHHRPALATNSVVVSLVFGFAAGIVVVALFEMFPSLHDQFGMAEVLLMLAAIPVLILQSALQWLVQSQYRFAATNIAWFLPPVANVALNGVFAMAGELSVQSVVAVWVGGQLLATLLLAWYTARISRFGAPNLRLAIRSLKFGAGTHLGRVMTVGNYRLDQWFVGIISGARELGLYSVAVAWAEGLFYLPTALGQVQRPDLVRASKSEAGRRTASVTRVGMFVTAVLTVALLIAAPFLCVTVFGEDFRRSVPELRILALGGFGVGVLKLLGNALNAHGRPMLTNVGVGVAFVATVGLDLLIVPLYGGMGAAIASTIAYSAGGVAIAIVFCRTLATRPSDLLPRGTEMRPLVQEFRAWMRRGVTSAVR